MNITFLSQIPKLQQFIADVAEENSTVDLLRLQNQIDLRIQQTSVTVNEVVHFYEYCQSQEFLKMHSSRNWTDEEWKVLIWVVVQYSNKMSKISDNFQFVDWVTISEIIAFKDALNCQFKWFSHLRVIPATKNWSAEEDKLLYKIMTREPNIKWFEVQYEMFQESEGQYFRKAKQYRERWNNYLNPSVNRGIWTEFDDQNLLQLAMDEGLRWSNISKKLKNRTENQVKNRFKSIINKEKKIIQIPQDILKIQADDTFKHGLDKMTEFLIRSILSRLKPVQKPQPAPLPSTILQEPQSFTQDQSFQQFQQYPMMMPPPQQYFFPQYSQMPQVPQMQQIPLTQTQLSPSQQIPSINSTFQHGLSIQIPQQSMISQQLLQQQLIQQQQQQTMMPPYYSNQFMPQTFMQQQQQFKFNVYSSQQNTPTNSIGTLSSQRSEKLISDQIKEEENSGSSSNKEPKVQKMVCVSAQSSIGGSTSSVNSMDAIKQNFNNMHIDSEQNSPDQILRRKHERSQSGAFDIQNQGKTKTKRSRFYYASNDG